MDNAAYPWTPVDPLGEVLHFLRMSGTFYCRSELTAPWSLEMPAFADCLSFHVVTTGAARLEVDDEVVELRPGDLALIPHGRGHRLRSDEGVLGSGRVDLLPQEMVSEHYSVLRYGGGGDRTTLVCGIVQFDHPTARRLVRLLPVVVHTTSADSTGSASLAKVLALMADEARRVRPGSEAVITRLADIVVIEAIRSWIERDPAAQQGWLRAMQDDRVGRALALVHRHPDRPWTVALLAGEVSMSRSAFAARFTELVGEPAMRYVTRWRMELATSALRDGETAGRVASRLGYESDAAFHRAYKRVVGVSPGSVARRQEARDV